MAVRVKCITLVVMLFMGAFSRLHALPSSHNTIAGSADINQQQNQMHVQASDRTILEWNSFNIGQKELLQFVLPSANSAILNRVAGKEASELLGQLLSNGKVYLLNPNGILIGKDAIIHTAGFVASTLNLSDEDFLAQKELLFSGDSKASITNLGIITCSQGNIALLGFQIHNLGSLNAEKRSVLLGAGQNILLRPEGETKLLIQHTADTSVNETGIDQQGAINALQAEIIADGTLYSQAIRHEGVTKACSIHQDESGRVILTGNRGEVDISGEIIAENGGDVHVMGQTIKLESAKIDASGEKGGTILIGGDFQGKNQKFENAKQVYVDPNTFIKANAHQTGDGGKAIVWSDEITRFYGTIHATGGKTSGNGGFIEVSSKGYLDSAKSQYSLMPLGQGKPGTLLFDPSNIQISTAATDPGPFASPFNPGPGENNPSVVNTTDLQNYLNATGNVVIATSNGNAGSGDITVVDTFTWTSTNTLTLNADRDIAINDDITGSGDLTLNAGRNITLATTIIITLDGSNCTATTNYDGAGVVSTDPTFTMNTTSEIATNGGDITIDHGSKSGNDEGFVTLSGATLDAGSGAISITGDLFNQASLAGIALVSSSTVTASGNITLVGTGGTTATNNIGHGINIDGSTISCTESGLISLTGTGSSGSTNTHRGVNVSNSSNVTSEAGGITIDGSSLNRNNNSNGVANDTSTISATSNGSITITATAEGGVAFSTAGAQNITSNGDISITATCNGTLGVALSQLWGMRLNAGSIACTESGNLTMIGTAGSSIDGIDLKGIRFLGATASASTELGSMTITGTISTSPAEGNGPGLFFNLGSLSVGSGGLVATGTLPANGNEGFRLTIFSITSPTGGDLVFIGSGGMGISLDNADAQVSTSGGNITMTGTGSTRPGGNPTDGISLSSGSSVSTTGSGTITMTGISGSGGTTNIGVNNNAGTISTENGDISITGTGTSTAGDYAIDLTAVPTISGTGTLTLTGHTNSINLPTNLSVGSGGMIINGDSSAGTRLGANLTATNGSIAITGPVTLVAASMITGTTGISCTGNITGGFDLTTAASGGAVTVSGTTNLSSSSGVGGDLLATASSDISFASILTQGADGVLAGSNAGTVSCTSSGGSVTVGSINTSGGNGTAGAGGDAGTITLTPNLTAQGISTGRIILTGNITALGGTGTSSGTDGTLNLSSTGRSALPNIASIVAPQNLTINVGTVNMGFNEAMTVFGTLDLAASAAANLSDIVTTDSIYITSGNLIWRRHAPGEIFNFAGDLYTSRGVHAYAVSAINLNNGNYSATGSGENLRIALVPYSSSAFQALLLFDNKQLNFDFPSTDLFPIAGFLNSELYFQLIYMTDPVYKPWGEMTRYRPVIFYEELKKENEF